MRKTVLPWLACAVIAAVVVPTLAWGRTRARARGRGPRDGGFIVGDNFFRGRERGRSGRQLGHDQPGRDRHVHATRMCPRTTASTTSAFDDGAAAHRHATRRRGTRGRPRLDDDDKSPMPEPLAGAGLGGLLQVQLARHLHVLLRGPRRRWRAPSSSPGRRLRRRPRPRRPRPPPRRRARRPARPLTAHDSGADLLVPGRVVVEHDRQQRHGHGRRPGDVQLSDAGRACTTSRSRPVRAPTTCVKTAGPGADDGRPPLPDNLSPPGWAGYCQFDAVGTYSFVCLAHPAMTGTVIVTSTPRRRPRRRRTRPSPAARRV